MLRALRVHADGLEEEVSSSPLAASEHAIAGHDVVGWGRRAPWAQPDTWTVSRFIGRELHRLGIRDAFGVLGGGIAPFADGLIRAPIRLVHTRHESGAVFAAIEAHFASDRPTAAVVTTGPGLFNALNGAMAARADGAKVLLVSGATARHQLGRGAVQETGPHTMPAGLTEAGLIFHSAARPESLAEVVGFLQRLAVAWAQPGGHVAHLALPWTLQTQILDAAALPTVATWTVARSAPTAELLDACLDALASGAAALWLGHGARGAAAELRAFAEATSLPVLCSPRAKGVFPEDHPLYVGTSGAGGHPAVARFFAGTRPDTLLVVGSRLGEVTTFLSAAATPGRRWIHVDIDPSACGAAFPGVPGIAVVSDAGQFARALLARLAVPGRRPLGQRFTPTSHVERPPPLAPRPVGDVRPAFLMQALQDHVIDRSDAVIMSEAGNSFTWCNYALRFPGPGRYRTSAAWGSMGHFTCGPVGAALASARRVVAVVGDGAMLMQNELSTAVAYQASAVWIVLNDAQLGLNEHGMRALGMEGIETQLPRTDFVALARSQGADGVAVTCETELADALQRALAATGPFVIDVRTDRSVPSPILALRVQSLDHPAVPQ
ncbi:MAG: thiamine pyrophosphate-dependent enzyme [Byssovorax sp.]